MPLRPLLTVTPFQGLDATTEPYYLQPGKAAACSNMDVSRQTNAFTTALGRTVFASFTPTPGYTVTACVPFSVFNQQISATGTKTIYVFCATNGTLFQVGYFDPTSATPVTYLPNASKFTQAVQFGQALWTNGGDKIFYGNTQTFPSSSGIVLQDSWQTQLPFKFVYGLNGTYLATSGNAPLDTYTYAVTYRRATWFQFPTPVYHQPNLNFVAADLDTLQESSPVFTTSVTITSGQQPGFNVNSTGLTLSELISGGSASGQPELYLGCLYRSRNGNPTFTFVDYLTNFTITNDHAGIPSIIDTHSDADISNNSVLTFHHDVPPIIGQTYPGVTIANSPDLVGQMGAQTSFQFQNPAFIAKHKSRMFVFTLYPNSSLGPSTFPGQTTQLQPQLWFSDFGTPWSFNDSAGVLLVGPEDTPSNAYMTVPNIAPWEPGVLPDTPMGVASVGSILVAFKSQTTWILYGDTPSEFIVRRAFDIGCLASNSVTTAEGGVFWLAPQGVYFFDGGAPSYIGEPIRALIEATPWATLQAATGSYRDRTYYLSIDGITYCYYIPTQSWYTLPYGAQFAISTPSLQNQLIFGSTDPVAGTTTMYLMQQSPATDNGQPIEATWTSGVSDSGMPGVLKSYRFLQFIAPKQLGICEVTLTLDPNYATAQSFSWNWDCSKGNGAFVASLPGNILGYEAQITIEATTNPNATTPMTIRAVVIHGDEKSGITSTSMADQSGAINGVLNS